MSKLIYANAVRMMKNKIFWIAEIFLAGYSIFAYAMACSNLQRSYSFHNGTMYFFHEMLFIGVIIAVLEVVFIGVEYGDGTIRNKISAGYTRKEIYLSNFIVCYAAGLIQFFTYCITSVISGLLLVGSAALTQLNKLPQRIGYSLLIILAYTALFSLLTMLDSNRARTMAAGILSVFVLALLTTQIYNDLQEPELTSRLVMSETGEMQIEENIPNRKYVSGTKRVVYEWIDAFLPTDQAMYVIDMDAALPIRAPLCLLSESMVLLVLGIYFFEKKDIK